MIDLKRYISRTVLTFTNNKIQIQNISLCFLRIKIISFLNFLTLDNYHLHTIFPNLLFPFILCTKLNYFIMHESDALFNAEQNCTAKQFFMRYAVMIISYI